MLVCLRQLTLISVGADQERDMTSAVTSVLGRLPSVQLYVLDAVVRHLHE